jgi:hypothetical protein
MSWPSAYIIPLIVASAVFGILSLVCGFVAGYAGHLEGAAANEAAAEANERAAELNKTAAQLRLDLEREQSKTAARPWTKEQFDAIQDVKGVVKDVGILWESHCAECGLLASHIMDALTSAGVQIYGFRAFDFTIGTGVMVLMPAGGDMGTHPLTLALKKAQLNPAPILHNIDFHNLRTDIPIIFVGTRFPNVLSMPYQSPGLTTTNILPIENH